MECVMKKYTVSASSVYDVLIGRGLLADAGRYLAELYTPRHISVITDSTVNGKYSQVLMTSLMEHGFRPSKILFPAGEHSKNLTTYANILEALAEDCISRSDLLIALGGGVVCDLAGFVAGTYMRGIDYIVIPTTLQAAIDTAIGGKAAINLNAGKNLAGVFWQPSLVLCDPGTFQTLPEPQIIDGLAEAVKCAAISDAGLVPKILDRDLDYVVERCISIKKSLVEVDERDTGLRQLLNFGHTAAHGIEKLSAYNISHGRAVAKGMIAEARGAWRMGLAKTDISGDLTEIFASLGITPDIPFSARDLYEHALKDKKIRDNRINMIIPESLGKCTLRRISFTELSELLRLGVEA